MTNKNQIAELRKEIDQPGVGSPMQLRKLAHSLLNKLEATQGGAAEAIRDCLRLKESLKAVTEELAKEKEHSANFEREANLYHGKCEAAEARNALVAGGIEAAVKLQERAEKAEREVDALTKDIENYIKISSELAGESEELRVKLAKLKGDAVPLPENIPCPSAPDFVWLQTNGDDSDESSWPVNNPDEVSWCVDKIFRNDTLYVRSDLFTHVQPVPVVVLPKVRTSRANWSTWQWIEHLGGRYQHGNVTDYVEFGSVYAVNRMMSQFKRTVTACVLKEVIAKLEAQGITVKPADGEGEL